MIQPGTIKGVPQNAMRLKVYKDLDNKLAGQHHQNRMSLRNSTKLVQGLVLAPFSEKEKAIKLALEREDRLKTDRKVGENGGST